MDIYKTLERAGLRPTLPRTMVLGFFQGNAHVHFSAEEVYKQLNHDERNMSLATVYRALAQLVEARLVSAVAFGDGRLVYELDDGNRHDHVVCTSCGAIDEFFDPEIDSRQDAIAGSLNFKVSGRQFVLFGLCAACRQRGVQMKTTIKR